MSLTATFFYASNFVTFEYKGFNVKNTNKKFLKLPEYPGGKEAFRTYIKENLIYPDDAIQLQIEGIVHIEAEINDNGEVLNVLLKKGIGAGCDEEAIRLIQNIQFSGVKNRGVRVKTKKKFRIEFKLPPRKTVNYQLISDKEKESIKKTQSSYSYSISIKKE